MPNVAKLVIILDRLICIRLLCKKLYTQDENFNSIVPRRSIISRSSHYFHITTRDFIYKYILDWSYM